MRRRWTREDRALGMDQPIQRRDFINGTAVAIGVATAGAATGTPAQAEDIASWPQDQPGYYPPRLQGLRGSHPGAFEAAHTLRDGARPKRATPLRETYDLIVVGAGLSGLSAAWFWRQKHPDARILILDNHDDFGGHAKRNELELDGGTRLMNGGTLMIDSPFPYSPVADGLLKSLGVDPVALSKTCEDHAFYHGRGMGQAIFFDKETFGQDKLVGGLPDLGEDTPSMEAVEAFIETTPLSVIARQDLRRLLTAVSDPWPEMTSDSKKDRLSRISYQAYLRDVLKIDAKVVAMLQTFTQGEWAAGIDAVSALDCWGFGMPGFRGLKLAPGPSPRMSFTPRGYCVGASYRFHFPDGNASIARLLVRALVPGALSGTTAEDIVTAKADYTRLDRPEAATRLRLSATVVAARHRGGDPDTATHVEVDYIRGGQIWSVAAAQVILACYNIIIPYICPELPAAQKAAMHELVKEPLVYTTVALRDWSVFDRLKISSVRVPGGYWTSFNLDPIVNIGGYAGAKDPTRPTLLRLTRTPCAPGLSEHDQNRAGRAELLATPYETFEREVRRELGRVLGPAGFDPARDITAIIVNRWPHGYAPERNFLWEPEIPDEQLPQVIARKRFGRIAIANSDCGGGAYTDVAIDMAHRAVEDLAS
jgi:spermidine dehydrogenase